MKLNKIFAVLALGIFVFTACNDDLFLEEHSYQNDANGFYQSERAMEIGLAAAYSNVQYMVFGNQRGGSEHNWMVNGLGLDTVVPTGGSNQFANWPSLNPDSGYARHWGDYMYKLANRANTVVDEIDMHPEIQYSTDTRKNELRAEGVFLRAYAYRILAGMFGNIVYSEHMTTEARYDYEMISREEAWQKIAADFEWAEQNLPKTPRIQGTVTKAAAAHYLAETYLALGEFKKAEDAATRVIDGTDGAYNIMTTRFGNRADQDKDRYGNSLAAPQGAYWDLFRTSVKTDGKMAADANPNAADNKEAIWVAQLNYTKGVDGYPLGASGDSWYRTHFPVLECTWAPWVPMGGKNGTRVGSDGKNYYIFTADAVCFRKVTPKYVDVEEPKDSLDMDDPDTQYWVKIKDAGTPASSIAEAAGRKLAYTFSTRMDSLACRGVASNGSGIGLGLYATEYVTRPYGDINGSVWNDPNDIRGSEVMIQRDYYTPSGKKWSEVKAAVKARVAAGLYNVTAADTVNITPRFWKFSDDKHPYAEDASNLYNDTDWYLIRIAETYLLRAEARLAQNNKPGAAADINVVRGRAGAADVAAADVNIDYILDERIRELFGEEQRWITLSRLSNNKQADKYISDCYPVNNGTTSNVLYERTRKYGYGYENDNRGRETYVDKMGLTRHIPNIKPYNYLLPIPTQIIQSNKDKEIPQNPGY